jgi:hypothetical protein
VALNIDLKEKLKTVNILASCGWFYRLIIDNFFCTPNLFFYSNS